MSINIKFTDGSEIEAGTIFCIGQNYSKHIAEMGSEKSNEPVIFIKPKQAITYPYTTIELPDFSNNIHYEVELVILIGEDCDNISPNEANYYIAGYGVGIDLTARDIQSKAKQEGKPWATAKSFRNSAPISYFIPKDKVTNKNFEIKLYVNDILKQFGNTIEMERSIKELVAYISKIFGLRKGDLIFTGTPEGVGQVKSGDKVTAELVDYTKFDIFIK